MDRDGYIFLWTDDDDLMRLPLEQPYKRILIPERDAMPRHAREEGNCISVHMDWIRQQMAGN